MTALAALARGYERTPGGLRRVVVAFDIETFDEVREYAFREKTSFAEAVRTLVTFGLESVNGTV